MKNRFPFLYKLYTRAFRAGALAAFAAASFAADAANANAAAEKQFPIWPDKPVGETAPVRPEKLSRTSSYTIV
jgi:hypothetical protein